MIDDTSPVVSSQLMWSDRCHRAWHNCCVPGRLAEAHGLSSLQPAWMEYARYLPAHLGKGRGKLVTLRFRCTCGRKLKGPDDSMGKRAKCPECHQWLRIPLSETYETVAKQVAKPDASKTSHTELVPKANTSVAESEPEASGGGGKACIVAADGDPAALTKLVEVLKIHGYTVYETDNGGRAIEMIREHCPDAAVLDVHLENLAGFQVIKQIRDMANDLNKDVWQMPVVMTTGKIRGRDKQYAISIGVQGYFDKPLNPARLCARLEKEIAKYRAL